MLEEVIEESQPTQKEGVGPHAAHWRCDCTQCIHVEDVQEETAGDVLAVTRSKKYKVQSESEEASPIDWQVQKEVRTGVIKELQKLQGKEKKNSILPVQPLQKLTDLPVFQNPAKVKELQAEQQDDDLGGSTTKKSSISRAFKG